MSPEEHQERAAAAVAAMFSVGNPYAAATIIEATVESVAAAVVALVRPEHHADMLRVMARGALKIVAEQNPAVVKEAGELLEIYRKYDKGSVS